MKFKFSLEKVLNHRNVLVNLAQKDFLEAENLLRIEIQNLDQLKLAKETALSDRGQLAGQVSNWSSQAEQINEYIKGQDLRISRQSERLKEFEKVVEEKREILRNAMVEAKIIDKLREKKLEEFKLEEKRSEQKEIDEMVSLRHGRFGNTMKGENEDGI